MQQGGAAGRCRSSLLIISYLFGCDMFLPFDVQESQDVVGICVNMGETRGHSSLLVSAERDQQSGQRSGVIKRTDEVICLQKAAAQLVFT